MPAKGQDNCVSVVGLHSSQPNGRRANGLDSERCAPRGRGIQGDASRVNDAIERVKVIVVEDVGGVGGTADGKE
jgi:hypothetical protein